MAKSWLTTEAFWIATAERAVKTFAQAAALAIGQDVLDVNLFHADFEAVAGFGLGGLVLSVLTSLASGGIGSHGPSLANERITGRHAAN